MGGLFLLKFLIKAEQGVAADPKSKKAYGKRGSNPRPLACEASVITTRPYPLAVITLGAPAPKYAFAGLLYNRTRKTFTHNGRVTKIAVSFQAILRWLAFAA